MEQEDLWFKRSQMAAVLSGAMMRYKGFVDKGDVNIPKKEVAQHQNRGLTKSYTNQLSLVHRQTQILI